MDPTTSRTRRTLLAAIGSTLAAGAAVGAVGADPDSATAADSDESVREAKTMRSDHARASSIEAGTESAGTRTAAMRMDNGIVVHFRDCSRVRIFGNPFAADLVSVFIGYYTDDGRWQDGVHDAEADLPMTIDVNERYDDSAASRVVIGGVDVFERTDGGPRRLLAAQPPAEWDCHDQLEEPSGDRDRNRY